MKTIVYVDGFNLFYRALKRSKHKWLNLRALCEASLPKKCNVTAINYYTARVSGRINSNSPKYQHQYLSALATVPGVAVHYGKFQVVDKSMCLVQPVQFRPPHQTAADPNPQFAMVVKTEEKGSDVNLGAHLIRDAFMKKFEHAAVITNDTDLLEPMRIVVEEANLKLTLLSPVDKPASSLVAIATHVRHVSSYLGVSQFPDVVIGAKGEKIRKPMEWF